MAGDTAGVLLPPPLIFAAACALGWLLDQIIPLPLSGWAVPGGMLMMAALAIGLWAVVTLRRARTAVNPMTPTTALVRTGPFDYSRNPIYVAMTLLSLGLAGVLGTFWCVLLLVPAVVVLRIGVIAREEAYLARRFGDEYREYCGTTHRWF